MPHYSLLANAQCGDKKIRLIGGRLEIEGRVEVCLNGQWSTVCDSVWGSKHARVACRELGYSEDSELLMASASITASVLNVLLSL